jgi:ubiquinone/menaquinone biosynthesis C-methylase UbiE
MNILGNFLYFYQRKIVPGFRVTKDDLVIDIGSGDKPFWRADVFVDDLSLGNDQRFTDTQTIHTIGHFVNANAEHLPFKNKTFDFSFTSHLLEHVTDPGAVIDEIVRVSKRGYIEVPNGILETVNPFESHLWFVYKTRDKLFFVRKSKRIHAILRENGSRFVPAFTHISDPFIRMYWEGSVQYEVIDDYTEKEKYRSKSTDTGHNEAKQNWQIGLVALLRKLFYKEKTIPKNIYKRV